MTQEAVKVPKPVMRAISGLSAEPAMPPVNASVAAPVVEQEVVDNPLREARLNDSRDFRPEWDVAALNAWVSKTLLQDIARVTGRREPDPGQLIPVLLSPGGYGKTHLFGRLAYELRDRAFFVFVGAIPDPTRPLEHIRWNVVEALFRSQPGQPSVLSHALANLFRDSMVEYLRQFPPSEGIRHQDLARELHEGNEAALKIARTVRNLRSFQMLASSTAEAMPDVHAAVIKALVMGWSPQQHLARQWLRGEGLPEEEARLLGVEEQSPAPLHVLQGVAAILQYRMPMVICCDQLDAITKYPDAPGYLADQLMQLLAAVPCQYLALSCLENDWQIIVANKGLEAFRQRTQPFNLDFLTEDQAVVLLSKRLANWPLRKAGDDPLRPFNRASVERYVRDAQPPPRIFIRRCAAELDRWVEGEIVMPAPDSGASAPVAGASTSTGAVISAPRGADPALATLFQQEWEKELDAIRRNPQRRADHVEEARLYKALKELIILAQLAGGKLGGLNVESAEFEILNSTTANPKYGLRAVLKDTRGSVSIVAAASKVFGGGRLVPFVKELLEAGEKSAGILLLHVRSAFAASFVAKGLVEDAKRRGKLIVYAMEDHPDSFESLECALSLLEQAHSSDLLLGTTSITYEQCQGLILGTKVIDNLDLFTALASWNASAAGAPAAVSPGAAPSNGAKHAPARPEPGSRSIPKEIRAARLAALANERPPAPAPAGPGYTGNVTPEETAWATQKLAQAAAKLCGWGQQVQADSFAIGPSFVRLNVRPVGSKTSFKRVCDRAADLKTHLGLDIEPIIESHSYFFTIDIQRPQRQTVTLEETLPQTPAGKEREPLFPLGLDVSGKAHWANLSDPTDCHLLVAGTTGSGKSEFLKSILAALAHRLEPQEIQFVLIDTKRVTFNFSGTSPYFRFPVAYDVESALPLLKECEQETFRRYNMLQKLQKTDISELDAMQTTLVPRFVVIIDEFANLMEEKETNKVLVGILKKIGAMSRAAGIHMVLATQRPDNTVVPMLVRSNLPGKIALQVDSEQNSKLVLDSPAAAYLLGKGDLICKRGGALIRAQSPMVPLAELEKLLRIAGKR
jgi:hypothetical protein